MCHFLKNIKNIKKRKIINFFKKITLVQKKKKIDNYFRKVTI